MKKATWMVAAIVFSILVLSGTSFATSYTEIGDAGESLATAIILPGGTTEVHGTVRLNDADMYKFTWGGGNFYLNTMGTSFDSMLFLFNSDGTGNNASDNTYPEPDYLQVPGLVAGDYFFAISGYSYTPLDVATLDIFDIYTLELSSHQALAYWHGSDDNVESGSYQVNFAPINAVPEPAAFILIGAGLAGLAAFRKKFRA